MGILIMTKLDYLWAKFSFKFDTQKRMAISAKIASLLRNNFTLMDALHRVEMIESQNGKKPDEAFAIAMREIQKNMEQGMTFSEATRGWVPSEETLLLMSGNMSSLVVSLENVSRVVNGVSRIKRAMTSALAYPLFLFALTIGIIVMVGVYLVPPLTEAAGSDIVWRGTAKSLIWASDFANEYLYPFCIGFGIAIVLIWISLSTWTGKLRAVFDKYPPWNIYKLQISVSWMMSLAAMVSSGVAIPDAMRMLADNSNRYLRRILDDALHYIANGDNLGYALQNTGMDFPNSELIGDLTIYADMNDFDKNLTQISKDYLENSVKKSESVANTLNTVGILLISAVIAWIVMGTFQMQDQITAFLS